MAYRDLVIADAPFRYWEFDNTVSTDSITGSYAINGTVTRNVPGIDDGAGDAIDWLAARANHASSFTPGSVQSFECWIKTSSTTPRTFAQITSGSGSSLTGHHRLYMDATGALYWNRHNDSAAVKYGNPDVLINDDQWHHVGWTYHDTFYRVQWFVDGEKTYEATLPTNQGLYRTSFLFLGNDRWLTQASGTFLMDEMAYYNKILFDTDFNERYQYVFPSISNPHRPFRGWGIPVV